MPAAPSSPVRVLGQRPVSGVRCERPVSTLACPRDRVQCPVRASGVCALPRPLCPAEVRSWSAAVGRQPYGWDGRGRRGRPLRPCPARGLPESAPGARSWRRRCWASRASIWTWPSSSGGGWAVVSSTSWPTRIRPGAREDRSLVGAGAQRARLLRQADRHAAGESLGRSCRVEPNIKKPIGHIPLAKQN
jgi:hypothetical protein